MGASVRLTLHTNFKEANADMVANHAVVKKTGEEYTKMVKSLTTSKLDNFITKTKRMGAAVKATNGPIAGLIAQQKALRSKIQGYIKQGLDPLDDKLKRIRERYIDVTNRIEKNKAATKAAKDAVRAKTAADKEAVRVLKEKDATLKRLAQGSLRYIRIALLAAGAAAMVFVGGIIAAAASIEDAQAAFRPMLGSLEKAVYLVGLINETAATTPFQFDALADSAKQLLPAVNGSMSEVIKTIRMLGDTASGNAQRLDSVTRAYTKSMLRGRVDMRSLNMIAKAGVPIYTELAKSMGKNVNQLFKLSRQGKISSKDLTASFESMTSKGGIFFEGMKIASETLTGRISTLRDNIKFLAANLGNVLLPYAKEFVEISLKIVSSLRTITSDGKASSAILEGLAIAFGAVTLSLGGLAIAALSASGAFGLLATGISAVSAAMFANPIGLIVLAIAGLVASIIWLYRNWDFAVNRMKFMATFIAEHIAKKFEKISMDMTKVPDAAKLAWSKFAGWMTDKLQALEHEYIKFLQSSSVRKEVKAMYTEALGAQGRHRVATKKLYAKEQADLKASLDTKTATYKANVKLIGAAATALRKKLDENLGGLDKPGKTPQDNKPKVTGSTYLELLESSGNKEANAVAKFQSSVISETKAHLTKKMDMFRVATGERIAWLKNELSIIKSIEAVGNEEKLAAAIAVQDMISELTVKKVNTRVNGEKTTLKNFQKWLLSHYKLYTKDLKEQKKKEEKVVKDFSKWVVAEYKRYMDELKTAADEKWAIMIAANKQAWANYGKDVALNLEKTTNFGMQRIRTFVSATTNMIVNAAKTGKFAFKDMIASIASDLLRIQTNKIMTNMFTSLFSPAQSISTKDQTGIANNIMGDLLGPLFGGSIGSAAYATGGIISSPTMALMGESGTEAVVPLVRKNGILGVASSGGGSNVELNVQVFDQSTGGNDVTVQKSPNGKDLKILIKDITSQNIRTGKHNRDFDQVGINRKPSYS